MAKYKHLFPFYLILIGIIFLSCTTNSAQYKKKRIRFMFWGGFKELDIWETVENDFEKIYPDVDVVLEYTPASMSDYDKKVHLGLKGGTIPDIFVVDDDLYPTYAVGGNLENLEPYIRRDSAELKLEEFIPTALETFTYNGIRYGIPWDGFCTLIIYNKDIFDEAGLSYPDSNWTWDDFCRIAWILTRDFDGDGFIDQYGGDVGFTYLDLLSIIWAFGGNIMDKKRNHFMMNSPETIRGTRFVLDLKYKFNTQPKAEEMSALPTEILLLTGQLGMRLAPCYVMINLFSAYEESGLRWDIAHMPTGPSGKKGSRVSWDGIAMYAHTEYKQECWNLIKYILSPKIQRCIGGFKRAVPVRYSDAYASFDDSTTEQHEERYIEGFKYGRISPIMDRVKKMKDHIDNYLDRLSIDEPKYEGDKKLLADLTDLTARKDSASYEQLKRFKFRYKVEPYEIFLPIIQNGDTLIVLKNRIIRNDTLLPPKPKRKTFQKFEFKIVHGDTIEIFKPQIIKNDTLLTFHHRIIKNDTSYRFTPPLNNGNMFELFRHHIIHNDTVDILQGRVVNGDTTDFGLDYLEAEVFGENQ